MIPAAFVRFLASVGIVAPIVRIEPLVENLLVLFLLFLHAHLVKLRLEYHILVEFLIGAHE